MNNLHQNIQSNTSMGDLKGKTIRGGLVSLSFQGSKFFIRTISVMILARILVPEDFGLVGMVSAITGFFDLVKDAGLSSVTVQRENINDEFTSTLFWINMIIGILICAIYFVFAPFLSSFYHEPRLELVTRTFGACFIFSAASSQHQALLQREMRFSTMAKIDITSNIIGISVGIIMAVAGFGYWTLVCMPITTSIISMIFLWYATSWIPIVPRKFVEMRSIFNWGGPVTLNAVIMYIAYNSEKVLLGRYWGAETLGFYGRAYNLINLPTALLNSSVGWVAFPALSRIQEDPIRFRNYFLKGYSLVLALTIPITIACLLFADDIIMVFLGPKWGNAVLIFRLLAPTILAYALIHPFGWLLMSRGMVGRSLKMALVIAPLVIASYIVGLRYGAVGVAIGYSTTMTLLIFPMIVWARYGTPISTKDIFKVVLKPLFSGIASGMFVFIGKIYFIFSTYPIIRLLVWSSILLFMYIFILLYGMGQKKIYLDLLNELKVRTPLVAKPSIAD